MMIGGLQKGKRGGMQNLNLVLVCPNGTRGSGKESRGLCGCITDGSIIEKVYSIMRYCLKLNSQSLSDPIRIFNFLYEGNKGWRI
jgi:hypothetical protein